MLTSGVAINSSDIPSLLNRFFLVKYIIDPISWNELLKYVNSSTKELDLKLMMERYQNEGKFSAFFPDEFKNISEENIDELIKDYSDKKAFLKGGYIQVFLENYTDIPYCKAFLKKIGKPYNFFYNNYPYGTQLIITNDTDLKNRFSIPGNFCKNINGFYHYKDDAIDWDFSSQIETKRLHIKDDTGKEYRVKIDTPYKAYKVYAKKEYSKFFIGYNALFQKNSEDVTKIGNINKKENIDSIKDILLNDEQLNVNPEFILKFGTDVIEYESAKYEQCYQLNRILEKVNKKCGTSFIIDDFRNFLSLLSNNKEIKYKENYDIEVVKKITTSDELIENVAVVVEKEYAIQVNHNNAIDRVLKTFPDNPEPYELDDDKLAQIAKGIFDSEYKLKQELYYEDKDLPFSPKDCEYIKSKFNKLLSTQLSPEETQNLEYRIGLSVSEFSIMAMFSSLLYFKNDSDKLKFYQSLYLSEVWEGIFNAYEKYRTAKDKNETKFKNHELDADSEEELSDDNYDKIDNQEYYEQIGEIQNYIDLIDPVHSDLWNLLHEKLVLVSNSINVNDPVDIRKVFAENIKSEYWNQKHSWESLYNAYKKRCEKPLYTMPHFKAILDYVFSNLSGLEKKISDKPELIQRFQTALKYKKQIENALQKKFSGEKEKEFVNIISQELSFLCKVIGFHDSRIHIDYEVLVNLMLNLSEIGYEIYWFLFSEKNKNSIVLKPFFEDKMLSIYESCSSSLGGENNDR